jgi:hypothetical protein
MGHQHLLAIPKTKDWLGVVELIASGADLVAIAAASSRAAEKSMIDAADDTAVRQSFFLLTQIPQAALSDGFAENLRRLGLRVGDDPTLIDIVSALMDAIDRFVARLGRRTDFGEIAQLSAIESLQAVAGRELSDLFGANEIRTRQAIGALGRGRQFAVLARDFFARLTRRHLTFYLDRELACHVGGGRRFSNFLDHDEFDEAIVLHCREASRIIREFAEQWYDKHLAEGGIGRDEAGGSSQ